MKTFGLWMVLFLMITLFLGHGFRDWRFEDLIILSTLLSYIMYRLLKEEINEK